MAILTSFFTGLPETWDFGDETTRAVYEYLRRLAARLGRGHGPVWFNFPDYGSDKVAIELQNCFSQKIIRRTFTMPQKCRDLREFAVWAEDKVNAMRRVPRHYTRRETEEFDLEYRACCD